MLAVDHRHKQNLYTIWGKNYFSQRINMLMNLGININTYSSGDTNL